MTSTLLLRPCCVLSISCPHNFPLFRHSDTTFASIEAPVVRECLEKIYAIPDISSHSRDVYIASYPRKHISHTVVISLYWQDPWLLILKFEIK